MNTEGDESQDTTEHEEEIQKRRELVEQADERDAIWNGECTRCGSSDVWGTTLYDDHAGLEGHNGVGIDLCADCRDAFEDWLDGGEP